jgi:hypothetical protein
MVVDAERENRTPALGDGQEQEAVKQGLLRRKRRVHNERDHGRQAAGMASIEQQSPDARIVLLPAGEKEAMHQWRELAECQDAV